MNIFVDSNGMNLKIGDFGLATDKETSRMRRLLSSRSFSGQYPYAKVAIRSSSDSTGNLDILHFSPKKSTDGDQQTVDTQVRSFSSCRIVSF